MNEITLNDRLKLIYPEGFRPLSEEERGRLRMLEEGPGLSLSDPQRHMLVSLGWTRLNPLSRLFKADELAKNMESRVSRAMSPYGYRRESFGSRSVGGREAAGFRYSYTAESVPMYGESYALKDGRTLYYFHLYARQELKEESLPLWEQLLEEARWL